mmetsp:Transcript_30187/g.64715  ORF Transcript_30187/g.64715 Transcript_30187/m.64715 type:complete len:84 (-) Transcript_30187:33-284(-)
MAPTGKSTRTPTETCCRGPRTKIWLGRVCSRNDPLGDGRDGVFFLRAFLLSRLMLLELEADARMKHSQLLVSHLLWMIALQQK